MAFPEILNPADPLDSVIATVGPSELRAIKQLLADVFGLPVSPTQVTAPAFAITAGGVVSISQAGPTVAADPTVPLGIATKQYVDNKAKAVFQYTPLGGDVALPANVTTQILQTAVIPALAVSPNGHWVVRCTARLTISGSTTNSDTMAAFLQVNSGFVSTARVSSGQSFVLDLTQLIADGQTVQATLKANPGSFGTGTAIRLDSTFILTATDITIVAQPQ